MTRATALLIVLFGAALIAEQQSPAPPVFTVQQAIAGEAEYAKNCASCHMPDLSGNNEIPPLAGKVFMGTWGTRSTKDLFDYMSAAMPYGGPSLSTETYTLIVAYLLQSNGATAGTEALSASTIAPIESLTARVTPPTVPVSPDRAETTGGVAPADGGGDSGAPASQR